MKEYKLWIAGEWKTSADKTTVNKPHDQSPVGNSHQATKADLELALSSAATSFRKFRRISRFTRSRLLAKMAEGISARRAELVECLVNEAGKPVTFAEVEVTRAIGTFTIAAEEAKRVGGDVIPVDIDAGGRAFGTAVSYKVPRGPVLAITPFNFPLNLVAHKVAPALAAGNSILLKPPPQAPGASILLAEIFAKAAKEVSDERDSVPLDAFQVFNASNEVTGLAVTDPRISILSFTGSDKVGWILQEKAIGKKVLLELGGNAAVIVHKDANLERAAARCAFGGFSYSGQVCISVQRIYVHESVADKFKELLLAETAKLEVGDPSLAKTVIGPLIDLASAERISAWIDEAVKDGAKVLTKSARTGTLLSPAVLTGTKRNQKIVSEEVFGPVVVIETYSSNTEVLKAVNDSKFGLQAGIFTDSASFIREAMLELDVGGLVINEVPTYRADNLPYGGTKSSGIGREGVRYAIEEFCEHKVLVQFQG